MAYLLSYFYWISFRELEMKKFFEDLRTLGPDLLEYTREWQVWRSKQKADRAAARTIAASLKLQMRMKTIYKVVEAWDPVSDAVEPSGFPLPMERDVQAYDACGNMVDIVSLLNGTLAELIPTHWQLKSYSHRQILLAMDVLERRYPHDICVEYTYPNNAPAREFSLK